MRDKTDSLSVVETVKPSAHFDLPAFWSVLSPGFKNFWCLPVIHLPLASLFYPSLSSHYILNYSFNTSLFHFGCSSSPASSPLPAPPPQDQERAQKAQEAQPQRGRPPRQRGRPGSQPRPLLNQKKTHHPPPFSPLLPAAVCLSPCRPHFPKQFFTITAQNSLTKPPPSGLVPHCIVLPLALQVSLYHSQLHQQDNNKSLCTLFTFLSRSDVLVIPLLSLTYLLSWPTYSSLELNDDLKHGATLTCF